ncbi:MAG: DUF5752 family protein, partial [Actinomycetota bacterium]
TPDKVVFHHLYQSHLKYAYILRDYPNDFANWAAEALEDIALAEKLASFDPYHFATVAQARDVLTAIIEEHLWDLPTVPWVRPGFEFYFSYSTTIVAPTNLAAVTMKEFKHALSVIPETSLYYHFYEARKRHKEKRSDDFSVWIESNFSLPDTVKKIQDIDFYFFSLTEVKEKLLDILEDA